MNHRLWGMRTYLIGAMDRAVDHGVGWRRKITPFLERLGIVVLDPTNKPISVGLEGIEDRMRRRHLKATGQWDTLAKEIKLLRVVDLRMVDMSDFLIVNIDPDVHACGTYEEAFWGNRLKNPTLIHVEGGKKQVPDWLIGTFPHCHLFGEWEDLQKYLWEVHTSETVDTMNRWMFFDYTGMVPKVTVEDSMNYVPPWEYDNE